MAAMLPEEAGLLVVAPIVGLAAGIYFSRAAELSGRTAVALALVPYAGLVLAFVFC